MRRRVAQPRRLGRHKTLLMLIPQSAAPRRQQEPMTDTCLPVDVIRRRRSFLFQANVLPGLKYNHKIQAGMNMSTRKKGRCSKCSIACHWNFVTGQHPSAEYHTDIFSFPPSHELREIAFLLLKWMGLPELKLLADYNLRFQRYGRSSGRGGPMANLPS